MSGYRGEWGPGLSFVVVFLLFLGVGLTFSVYFGESGLLPLWSVFVYAFSFGLVAAFVVYLADRGHHRRSREVGR
jgi:ABC-type Fe3+-siderophore transport system permease subunit